jgi:hypothetical protein
MTERPAIVDHLLDYVAARIDREMDDDLIETVVELRKSIPHEEFVKMSFKGSTVAVLLDRIDSYEKEN